MVMLRDTSNRMIEYLFSTTKKTKEQIIDILNNLNIKGTILIGNQLMNDEQSYEIKNNNYYAKIYNLKSKGVSINRNYLIGKSTAEYITFLDDDMYLNDGSQQLLENLIEKFKYNAIRVNCVSDNKSRPIPLLKKEGFIGFRSLSPYGVCGCIYKREFLLQNNLYFNESVGPGTNINHGEDGLFNKKFLNFSKIYSIPENIFRVKQIDSTWQGENRDIEKELIAHGFIYYLLYGKHAKLMSIFYIVKHHKDFPKNVTIRYMLTKMFLGIKNAKK